MGNGTVSVMRLKFLRETALARHYEDDAGRAQWVPRSVCPMTRKYAPSTAGQPPVHEVEIEDWWLKQNPFGSAKKAEGELL